MSVADAPRYSQTWLELREPADAAARAIALLEPLREHLAGGPAPVICDLGAGSGSMQRWLAPRLTGPQHWILQDRDAELLEYAAAHAAGTSADGAPVTVETRLGDVGKLTAADLRGVSLVTASALLDLLTVDEVDGLAAACVKAACPALLTLSVLGRVEFTPADPLDAELTAGFNDHLRGVDGRDLLGPDAAGATADAFARRGATVLVRPSPWLLGQTELTAAWLDGWIPAACAQRPALAAEAGAYLHRRLTAPDLRVTVHHDDVLALPGRGRS